METETTNRKWLSSLSKNTPDFLIGKQKTGEERNWRETEQRQEVKRTAMQEGSSYKIKQEVKRSSAHIESTFASRKLGRKSTGKKGKREIFELIFTGKEKGGQGEWMARFAGGQSEEA